MNELSQPVCARSDNDEASQNDAKQLDRLAFNLWADCQIPEDYFESTCALVFD